MIERDRFAFAALGCLIQSEGDSEVIVDEAARRDIPAIEEFAKTAYIFGDAMMAEGNSKPRSSKV